MKPKYVLIFSKNALLELAQDKGLTAFINENSLSYFEKNLENKLPEHLSIFQREYFLGHAHNIDTLNSAICGSYMQYLSNKEIIITPEMFEHAQKTLNADASGDDRSFELLMQDMKPSGKLLEDKSSGLPQSNTRLTFDFSNRNRGICLPKILVGQSDVYDNANEFDFGELDDDYDDFEYENTLIRAQEDKLKQMIPAQHEQQLKQLYNFWSGFFKQHENQPGRLPKATAIDNKEFGHRQFVPYDLTEWKGLYDQYQDQISNPDKNG